MEKSLTITCPAFEDGTIIPEKYTCDGRNVNPPIAIAGIPAKAMTIVLLAEDPDAPDGVFVHWLIWNIPVVGKELIIGEDTAPGIEGTNGLGNIGYAGPCPPIGIHHYQFIAFALDSALSLQKGAQKVQVLSEMEPHILASGQFKGMYGTTKQKRKV